MLGRLVPSLFTFARQSVVQAPPSRQLQFAASKVTANAESGKIAGGEWSLTLVRNKVRCYFPRPDERKRIKRHGWFARMATPSGRRILMRRILKGKYTLSH